MSPRISSSHIKSRNAVNSLRLLIEAHGHIVEEVPGASDFGEDLRVAFGDGQERTGYIVSIQVKSGRSLRHLHGYRVPVRSHGSNWGESNLPVACIVHDPDEQSFFWANASKQLRHAKLTMRKIRSITVSRGSQLNEASLPIFVAEMRGYIDGSRGIVNAIEELAGIAIDPRDYVAYAPNALGERMAFIQPFGADHALLVHEDLEPQPIAITMEDLALPGSSGHAKRVTHELLRGASLLGDYVLSMEEAMWIASCFSIASGIGASSLNKCWRTVQGRTWSHRIELHCARAMGWRFDIPGADGR